MTIAMHRPDDTEYSPYFARYVERVPEGDIVAQLRENSATLGATIAVLDEVRGAHRPEPGKWSIRELLNHVSDSERAFAFRALWFGRGFHDPLPSYDQEIAAAGAEADRIAWASHVEEFRRVRLATVSLFRNMPSEGWQRGGVASGNHVTVRAIAFIIAGHATHHMKVLKEKYL